MGLLSGIFSGSTPARTALPRTSPAVAERINNILGIRNLEAMPAQAARAFQLASDANARQDDFVKVIESDEVLSARVVKIANSVYFFRGTPAHDIEKAVANIGLDELRCLLSASMLRSLLASRHAARDIIWANAVSTGIICRLLSRSTKHINPGEAFLCGLLHDVGKLIMVRKGGLLYDKVLTMISTDDVNVIDAEEAVFELNHVEVGKWVSELWHFPESARQSIALHHEPWPKNLDKFQFDHHTLVKAADLISHSIGVGHPPYMRSYGRRMDKEKQQILPQLGIGPELLDGIVTQFERLYEKEASLYQPESH